MPYQEIDKLIKKALLHPQKQDEKHANEAKERIWATIETKKPVIPWGMLTAMAACFLLLIVCGILFLKLDQQGDKLDEMTARIQVLEQNKLADSNNPLWDHTPSPEKEAKPVALKPKPLPEQPGENDIQETQPEFSLSIERTKPISGPVLSPPIMEIAIPKNKLDALDEMTAKLKEPPIQKPPQERLPELTPKNIQKFRIRLGSKGHPLDQNQSLALHIKL